MIKFVSIIIPCRNEGNFIGDCLDSILKQDYSKDHIEILVADGRSTDRTRLILGSYTEKFSCIKWFDNPKCIVPTGLNILLGQLKGEVVIRMDAHSEYPADYVSKCVHYLFKENVDNVGGIWITLPGANTYQARSIALALTSGFGVGNALYRTGNKAPQLVDTVPFGCFKREVFDRIGLFDEDLIRNQDDEFNARLIKSGGKILLVPEISSKYYARPSYSKLWRMYFQYGYFKPLTVLKLGGVMTWRQLIPAVFIGSLGVFALLSVFIPFFRSIALSECLIYILANIVASTCLCSAAGIYILPYLMAAFFVIHFGYGTGYLKGILDFLILNTHLKNRINDMAISR